MRSTGQEVSNYKITVDLIGLQKMLSIGKGSCRKIGKEAGAVIKVGRRTLYNVQKIEAYLNEVSEV